MTMTANITKLLLRSHRQLLTPFAYLCRPLNHSNFFLTNHVKFFSSEKADKNIITEKKSSTIPNDERFQIFRDEDSKIVFDVSEELERINLEDLQDEVEYIDPYAGLNMTRGKTGVFDIEDLVELLKKDNARNIFVVTVPKDWVYVDYIVIVTAKSVKHMRALMTFVRKAYKIKRHETDRIPKPEGKTSVEWQAVDLGNIALHIFTQETRERFDLETLWAVGSKYDDLTNKVNQMDIVESYNSFLQEFEPAES